jgi:hypothetical protein
MWRKIEKDGEDPYWTNDAEILFCFSEVLLKSDFLKEQERRRSLSRDTELTGVSAARPERFTTSVELSGGS